MTYNYLSSVSRRARTSIRMQLDKMRCNQFGHVLGPSKRVGAEEREYSSCKRCHVVAWSDGKQ